jgi:hypothetical protein
MAKSEALITIRTETGNSDANLKKLDKEINNVKKSAKGTNQGLSETTDVLGQMGGPLGSAAGGIKSLGTAFKALLASPIGIVLGLIAGIVALLSRLDPVVDKVEQGLDALTAIFDTLAGNLAKVGKLMMQLTMFDLSGATRTAQELGSAMGEAANEAIDLRKSIQALEDVENDYTVSTAKAEASVKNLLIQAKNVNLSYKEKIKILNEASRIEKEDFENGLKIAQEKARIAKGELARIDKAGVDRGKAAQEAAQAEANLIRVQGQSADLQEKIQNRIDLVNQAAEEKRKKIEEGKKKAHEEEIKRLEELAKKEAEFLAIRNKATLQFTSAQIELRIKEKEEKEAAEWAEVNAQNEADRIIYENEQKALKQKRENAEFEKKIDQEKLNARMAYVDAVGNLLGQISTLVGQQSEEGKAIAAAATLIDTYVAAFRAYTEGYKIDPTGVFSVLAAAAATATGLKAVQNILNTNAKGSGLNVSGSGASAPPPITRPSSSFVQLDNTNPLNVNNTGMTKVVVVESDITQVQSKVKSIKAKATIG